jgi:hypothetical protein
MAIASLFFAASSCSDDLDEDNGSKTPQETEKAYISVVISSPDDATRAEGTDPAYEMSTSAERAISSADFYFFASDGTFYSHQTVNGQLDGDKTDGTEDEKPTANHIEWQGKTTVLVPDYDATTPPAYMVTILNQPSNFGKPETFEDLNAKLAQIPEADGLSVTELPLVYKNSTASTGNFIMTTSSYYNTSATTREPGVTYLNSSFFYPSEEKAAAADANQVEVYVERLAVKVRVSIDPSLTAESNGSYQIKNSETEDGSWPFYGEDNGKALYAKFGAWGINCQPSSSYILKQIDKTWTDDALGFTWNDSPNYRSYWGMSVNYNSTEYNYLKEYEDPYADKVVPNYTGGTRATDEVTATNSSKKHLIYLSANQLANTLGGAGYCPENTISGSILKTVENYQGAVTCVLCRATLIDANGDPQDVIYYNKKFFNSDDFKDQVLKATQYQVLHNYDAENQKLDTTFLKFVDNTYDNGHVDVQLKSGDPYDNIIWKDENNNTVDHATINTALKKLTETAAAVHYVKGDMYYSIPIEHLRSGAPSKSDLAADRTKVEEGHFGVVRNHLYAITIEDIQNPGHGIQNPDEPIVPPIEKDEKYYIGVKVNILSWKNVSQNVTL